jgi:hypothetical protein
MMKLAPLMPDDYPRLKPFFAGRRHELCIYSLSSLLSWSNEAYHPCGAVDGDTLIIAAEFTTRKENRHLILPVNPRRDPPPERLKDYAQALGFGQYWFIPENYVAAHGLASIEKHFTITEQPEYEDYIYRTEDLAWLKGNRYSKKRNLVNQFTRDYVDRGVVALEPITAAVFTACADFLEEWCLQRGCERADDEDLACEKQAALNMLENIERYDVRGLLLRIEGEVLAFGIGMQLAADMGALHFEKADANEKGLYQYFDMMCARRLFPDCLFINKESDMGVPGLAKAKRSYHPVRRVKSYALQLR